jgi:hypothetical protein
VPAYGSDDVTSHRCDIASPHRVCQCHIKVVPAEWPDDVTSHRHIATCQGKGCYKPRCPDKKVAPSHRVHDSSRSVPAQFPHSSRTVPATVPARESLYNHKIRANDGAAPGGEAGEECSDCFLLLIRDPLPPPWGCTVIRANLVIIQGFSSGNCSGNCAGTVWELSGNCAGTVGMQGLGSKRRQEQQEGPQHSPSTQVPRCDDAMRIASPHRLHDDVTSELASPHRLRRCHISTRHTPSRQDDDATSHRHVASMTLPHQNSRGHIASRMMSHLHPPCTQTPR